MRTRFIKIQEMIDSLTLEEQEQILAIAGKRLIEKKRTLLLNRVEEGRKDLAEGRFAKGNVEDIMKAIDDELDNFK